MKINLKIFDLETNIPRYLNGLSLPLFGSLVYLIFPPPDHTHMPYKSNININKHTSLPNFIGQISSSLPSLIIEFLFMLITNSWFFYQKICSFVTYTWWFLRDCVFKFGKIFNSSLIKRINERKTLRFKSASIFAISIFFTSILSVNTNYHHFLNSIYNDDCLNCYTVCSKADDVSDFSIYNNSVRLG